MVVVIVIVAVRYYYLSNFSFRLATAAKNVNLVFVSIWCYVRICTTSATTSV